MASSSKSNKMPAPLSTVVDQFVIDIHNICSNDTPVRIRVFKVPESLSASKPEAYFPQKVGLGLLHHNRSEIGPMQMYKLDVARIAFKAFEGIEFGELIEQLMKRVPSIRASYPMYLSYNDSTVAYVMAVDGLFLLKLLSNFFDLVDSDLLLSEIDSDELLSETDSDQLLSETVIADVHDKDVTPPAILLNLAKGEGARLDQDGMILRDTVMLENQIPLFVLKAILHMECSEKQSPAVEKYVNGMLVVYCKTLSPFNLYVRRLLVIDGDHDHLLALFYQLIMSQPPEIIIVGAWYMKSTILEVLGGLLTGLLGNIGTLIDQVIRVVPELPWSEIFQRKAQVTEHILIPTASHLCAAKVKFSSAQHITAIWFNRKDITLWLPTIKVGVNSEVVIRNLVAYEAMSKSEDEPLLFARYIELMSGIIKTADDVKLLRDQGIIDWESMEDEDVVNIFSGMSKPVRVIHPKKKEEAKDGDGREKAAKKKKREKAAKGLQKAIREVVKIFSGMCKPVRVIHPKKKKAAKDDEDDEDDEDDDGIEKAAKDDEDDEDDEDDDGIEKAAKDDDEIEKAEKKKKEIEEAAEKLEKAITGVNEYYNGLRKVKAHKIINKWVSTLWQMRSLFAAILLLLLVALQTYCSVFGCSRISNKTNQ